VTHLRFSAASSAGGMVSSDRRDGVFHSAPLRCLLPTVGSVEIPDSPAGFLESKRGVSLICCQVPRRYVQLARWRKCQRRSNASLFILVQVQAGPPPRSPLAIESMVVRQEHCRIDDANGDKGHHPHRPDRRSIISAGKGSHSKIAGHYSLRAQMN
jgi:hypothetical protein